MITLNEVRSQLEAIVDEVGPGYSFHDQVERHLKAAGMDPGDVFQEIDLLSCSYEWRPEGGEGAVVRCIVGEWLHRHHPDAYEQAVRDHNGDPIASALAQSPLPALEPSAEALLVAVQRRQDQGASWGEALRRALSEVGTKPLRPGPAGRPTSPTAVGEASRQA